MLDAGKVLEYDEPAKLLADEKSSFYSMAKEAGLLPQKDKEVACTSWRRFHKISYDQF